MARRHKTPSKKSYKKHFIKEGVRYTRAHSSPLNGAWHSFSFKLPNIKHTIRKVIPTLPDPRRQFTQTINKIPLVRGIIDTQTRNDVCKRRYERKRMMFATGRAGGRVKPPKYNLNSLVRC